MSDPGPPPSNAGDADLRQEIVRLRARLQVLEQQAAQAHLDAPWPLSGDLMLRCAADGTIAAANPAWQEVLGWASGEVVGSRLFDLVHPDDLIRTAAWIRGLSAGPPAHGFKNRYRHRDGRYRWINWSARVADDRIDAVGRDVTVEEERAADLRDSMDFTRLALSAVGGVGVWRYDAASDRFFCDAAIADLYGIDVDEGANGILRERFLANVHPDDTARLHATMSGGLVRPGDLELEYRIRHPDGSTRWVLSRGHTYFDGEGKPVRRTGVGVEMTRQRQLEEQLRQSQKLEAVGQLTGGIAHDFNNMLSMVNTSIELVRRRLATASAAELERYLATATKGVRGAASLTQRLLAFSRKQTLDIQAVDVARLARGLEDLLRRTLGERISLLLALDDDAWSARTDANQLENALVNLAINARDAMPDGGLLTIAASNLPLPTRSDTAVGELAPGDYLVVSVSDTGSGMAPDVLARAFDPFFTTKPIGRGTGLGLSMIYGYARQSGGDVTIESVVDRGTTVKLYLPRADACAAPAEAADAPAAAPGTGERILVVEDEPDVRAMIVEVLQSFGYRTFEAANATAALALLATARPFELLLTDVGLPGMTGRELAARAQGLRPGLKVLFLTGYAREAYVRSDFLAEGMDMMAKPFDIDELALRVRGLVQSA